MLDVVWALDLDLCVVLDAGLLYDASCLGFGFGPIYVVLDVVLGFGFGPVSLA